MFGVLSYILGKIRYLYCQFLKMHLLLQYILGLVFCSNAGPSMWINFEAVSNVPWVHLRANFKLSLNRIPWVPHEVGSGRQRMLYRRLQDCTNVYMPSVYISRDTLNVPFNVCINTGARWVWAVRVGYLGRGAYPGDGLSRCILNNTTIFLFKEAFE